MYLFYDRVKEVCRKQNTTITTVLKKIGVTTASVGNWKKGTIPNGNILIKLSKELNVSIDYLLELTDNPEINK